jgi:hypothetical protein
MARFDNSYMTDSVARYPDRLRCVGGIDHDGLPAEAVEAAMRSMLGQGVTGFRIERACAKGDASWLGSAGMERMWAVAAETRQAVCLALDVTVTLTPPCILHYQFSI